MSSTISVPWECVQDGMTRERSNFKRLIQGLLDDGFTVDVTSDGGQRKDTFTTSKDFGRWFDEVKRSNFAM